MKEQTDKIKNKTAVALGFFDGIHLGHRAVIGEMIKASNECGLVSSVYTFYKNPASLFGKSVEVLTPNEERLHILNEMGVQQVVYDDFEKIMNLEPLEFVEEVLVKRFNASQVFCGFNYHFGKGGTADSQVLKDLCGRYGIDVTVVDPVIFEGEPVSSTRIRKLIKQGDIIKANELLGHRFGFSSVIEEGNHIGRLMDTPTINQKLPENLAIPKFGVYTSIVTVEGEQYAGVTNIGVKPTVGEYNPLSETWLPLYKGKDLYGKKTDIRLVCFQRPEKKFGSIEELQSAIKNDGKNALQRLHRMRELSAMPTEGAKKCPLYLILPLD